MPKLNANTAVSLLIVLLQEASRLGAAISRARAEGREDLTEAELDEFVGRDDAARARLRAKIDSLPGS